MIPSLLHYTLVLGLRGKKWSIITSQFEANIGKPCVNKTEQKHSLSPVNRDSSKKRHRVSPGREGRKNTITSARFVIIA